jgi:hypothetical protein
MAKVIQLKDYECYQLKISLNHIKPAVWRRFIVDPDIKLPDLHKVIQTVMGWTNSHLHQFVKDKKFYSEPDEDSYNESIDYRKIKLNQILSEEGQSFSYEYDFGDGWEHKIILEKILKNRMQKYPVCIDGKRNCPPEDCGGPYGYENLLEAISNPEHEDHEDMIEWIGDDFDSEYFDIEEINEMLKKKNYGCITIF